MCDIFCIKNKKKCVFKILITKLNFQRKMLKSVFFKCTYKKGPKDWHLKEIVGAIVIFDHGLKCVTIFLVSDHPAHEKLVASKKKFFTIE
jgi:hypothetical protein